MEDGGPVHVDTVYSSVVNIAIACYAIPVCHTSVVHVYTCTYSSTIHVYWYSHDPIVQCRYQYCVNLAPNPNSPNPGNHHHAIMPWHDAAPIHGHAQVQVCCNSTLLYRTRVRTRVLVPVHCGLDNRCAGIIPDMFTRFNVLEYTVFSSSVPTDCK